MSKTTLEIKPDEFVQTVESNPTIYEKLQRARVELNAMGLKKSGRNDFAKYDYFELTDFLTESDKILLKYRLTPSYNFKDDRAWLELFDWDSDKTMLWETHPEDATTLNKQGKPSNLAIQTLGSQHTYLKRYLYMHLMNIAENDGLERNTENPEFQPAPRQEEPPTPPKLATLEQRKLLNSLYGDRIEGMLEYLQIDDLTQMKEVDAIALIQKQQAINKQKEKQVDIKDL